MIDIHSHILPGVDDGSQSIDQSIEMIKKEIADGVDAIILTPHVQSKVSKFDPSHNLPIFNKLQEEAKKLKLPIDLYLGAETFYRSHIKTDFRSVTMGASNYILIEFSPYIETPIEEIVYDLTRMGFIPIIAHVERYSYLKPEDFIKIKTTGALLQVNTSSIIGYNHKNVKKNIVQHLIKNQLIDFISTDTHNIDSRPPNMKEAFEALKKNQDKDYLNKIFDLNARKIIDSIKHID